MITVKHDRLLNRRGHTAMDMEMTTTGGQVYKSGIDTAPGFPGNPLTEADHLQRFMLQRFMDCIDFASDWFSSKHVEEIFSFIKGIEKVPDVRGLIYLLTDTVEQAKSAAN